MKFHWITAVWGERYTELFVNLVMPTQLSTGNFPALQCREHSVYKIYAPATEIAVIRASSAYARLAALVPIQFIEIGGADAALLRTWPHEVMIRCHKRAYEDAIAEGAAAVFLAPDAILTDGSFAALERRALEGYSILLTPGLLAAVETGRPWIESRCREADGSICLTSQQATAMTRRCPQSFFEKLAVTEPEFANNWPSYMWASVNSSSLIYRAWHLHPILVHSRQATALVTTIDSGEFFDEARAAGESFYLFDDASEFCLVELSSYDQRAGYLDDLRPFSADRVAAWVTDHTSPAGRELIRRSIVFDAGDATPAAIAAADRILTECVDSVLTRVGDGLPVLRPLASLDALDRAKPIYFYGAGAFGQELLGALGDPAGWDFRGFIDSRHSGECQGFPVFDPEQFRAAYRSGDQVVITSMYVSEIAATLGEWRVTQPFDATIWYRRRRHLERVGSVSLSALALEGYLS